MTATAGVAAVVLKVVVPDGTTEIAQIRIEHVQPYLRGGGAQLIDHNGGENAEEQDDSEDFDKGESRLALECSFMSLGSNNVHVVSMRFDGWGVADIID